MVGLVLTIAVLQIQVQLKGRSVLPNDSNGCSVQVIDASIIMTRLTRIGMT